MIILQRYIFKELVYNFIFAFVVISAVVLLAGIFKAVYEYSWIGLDIIVTMIPYLLLGALFLVLPSATLVSVVATYGRMAADNEIVALKSTGVHLFRIVVPGILFGLILSLVLLVANDRYVPEADKRIKTLGTQQNLMIMLDNVVKRGQTLLKDIPNLIITWESSVKKEEAADDGSPARWEFKKVRVKRYENNSLKEEFVAESMEVVPSETANNGIEFVLIDANQVVGGNTHVAKTIIPFTMSSEGFDVRLGHRSLGALMSLLKKRLKLYINVRVLTEIHSRIAWSISPLLFVFLGLPLATLFRYRNRFVAFLIAILIGIFIYYPIMILGETMALEDKWHPALCIWPGNALLLVSGIWLLARVARR